VELNYIVWKEDLYYVSQCLNVEVASFGSTIEDAIQNLIEAVELYFENDKKEYQMIEDVLVGSKQIALATTHA